MQANPCTCQINMNYDKQVHSCRNHAYKTTSNTNIRAEIRLFLIRMIKNNKQNDQRTSSERENIQNTIHIMSLDKGTLPSRFLERKKKKTNSLSFNSPVICQLNMRATDHGSALTNLSYTRKQKNGTCRKPTHIHCIA